MSIWPWRELSRLRRELRAARRGCSAEAKRGNRLSGHIKKLERKIERHRAQEHHDQTYIEAMEARLAPEHIQAARAELRAHGPFDKRVPRPVPGEET